MGHRSAFLLHLLCVAGVFQALKFHPLRLRGDANHHRVRACVTPLLALCSGVPLLRRLPHLQLLVLSNGGRHPGAVGVPRHICDRAHVAAVDKQQLGRAILHRRIMQRGGGLGAPSLPGISCRAEELASRSASDCWAPMRARSQTATLPSLLPEASTGSPRAGSQDTETTSSRCQARVCSRWSGRRRSNSATVASFEPVATRYGSSGQKARAYTCIRCARWMSGNPGSHATAAGAAHLVVVHLVRLDRCLPAPLAAVPDQQLPILPNRSQQRVVERVPGHVLHRARVARVGLMCLQRPEGFQQGIVMGPGASSPVPTWIELPGPGLPFVSHRHTRRSCDPEASQPSLRGLQASP